MVTLKFHNKEKTSKIEVEACPSLFGMSIRIEDEDGFFQSLLLDKSTAIKLSKELRKQIALLD